MLPRSIADLLASHELTGKQIDRLVILENDRSASPLNLENVTLVNDVLTGWVVEDAAALYQYSPSPKAMILALDYSDGHVNEAPH